MKLYIKQRVFSWGDKFDIYNEKGEPVFHVKGEIISLGKKLHLYNMNGEEIGYIHQKLLSFLPCYYIGQNNHDIAEVVKELSLFKPKYSVKGPEWKVEGNFLAHDYRIESSKGRIAEISKKWVSFGDSYEVDILNRCDDILVISVVLVIDAVLAAEQAAQKAANNRDNN